ncbi:MAG: hypothetical protein AAGF11_20105 [Myxococcota bacterium]
MKSDRRSSVITILPLLALVACSVEPSADPAVDLAADPAVDPAPEASSLSPRSTSFATTRGFAIEGNIDAIAPLGDICVVHLYNENVGPTGNAYTGLVVTRDDDDLPPCQQLDPYLDGGDRLLEWNDTDAAPITDLNTLQNLAEAFDQASGRTVDYFTLTGPVRQWLWGATYGNGGTGSFTGLGDACVLFVETDAGDTIGLVELQEAGGACPNVGPFLSGSNTVQIREEDTMPVGNATAEQEITDALYPGGTVEYRFADQPPGLLYSTSLGGEFEGVTFTDEQALAALELANNASFEFLDDVVPLHVWAAQSIVANRPLATIPELGALYWVGPSALTKLRDFQCPAGTELVNWECVASDPLLPFGADCLGLGGEACESGLCTTTWDGYFCYYTACTGTCTTADDCEDQAIDAGLEPQLVQGNMFCSNAGICETYLLLGGESCE